MKRMESIMIMVMVFAAMFYVWQTFEEAKHVPEYKGPVQQVVVSEGDSIWKIAEQSNGSSPLTLEESVEWMLHHNHIEDATVMPGQAIQVPAGGTGVAME
ncbi:cell division suppressor protein YneA [Salisediminibacterium beveridgei]|uniref:LysM domain-containing protein n=1 Tax=Salisediminibacterium beveridgei TaxID=632773 RepID=A0A1D7QVR0_9BACI|nr:LysM peptidoglycan-binding domain-containing protein [Salisediminibacterium beveridgei]AOM83100.1 hypothetical protein BBEV_1739 [Salisediminibacterium beveridgei]